jgi:dTDP-4-amino-4,6-dideoxygalactose transaminase
MNKYNIPLFKLNFDQTEEDAIIETIRSRWISTGPKTSEFESKFSQALNVKHSLALANCTVALHLALKVLDIKESDEVICPSLTFVATVNAIKYVNAVPVFCDIKSLSNPTIDPEKIESLITSRTKAIMVMHYGGFSCDMSSIRKIADKYNLRIVEDACHGPLSEFEGKKLGTIGDIGCFSFFSNKNMSTGEGGMITTNNTELFEKAKLLRSHGMTSLSYERSKGHSTGYDVVDLGFNYRMDDLRAALGIVQLEKLPSDLDKRVKIRQKYIDLLKYNDKVIIPFLDHKFFSSNYIFPVVLKNSDSDKREFIRKKLAEVGIQTSVHYPAVHRFSIYKNLKAELPVTEYFSDNEITLPMYSSLSDDEVGYIVSELNKLV